LSVKSQRLCENSEMTG